MDYCRHHQPFDPHAIERDTPIDIIVTLVDHFEPPMRFGEAYGIEQVDAWCDKHREIAERFRDADGRPPQHTWFYRSENRNQGCLEALGRYAYNGFGEVEFHLHHGHDSHALFTKRLRDGLDWFNQSGAMLTAEAEPSRRFAYIAGNWALDNGTGDDRMSGCNTELLALRETGCYADFTFPALGSYSQPRKTNSLYYATDDPGPKSYNVGTDVAVGEPASGDLLIFQGPLVVDWNNGHIEAAAIENFSPPSPERLDNWLKANIHVRGRPEWIFVKLHTHGMQSRDVLLGPGFDAMLSAMVERWNRPPFRLHFTTAREAYNMIKAAEAGLRGNPNDYRDFAIPRPANREVYCRAPWRLLSRTPEALSVRVDGDREAAIEVARGPIRALRGSIRQVDARFRADEISSLRVDGDGPIEIEVNSRRVGHRSGRFGVEELNMLFERTTEPFSLSGMVEWPANNTANFRPKTQREYRPQEID